VGCAAWVECRAAAGLVVGVNGAGWVAGGGGLGCWGE
jgi:hypothetical protein